MEKATANGMQSGTQNACQNTQLRVEYVPVEALRPYEHNARRHQDADVAAIAESIRAFGFDDPIGIWGEGNLIVEGHGRLLAAKQLGMDSVPVIRLDHLTDERRRAYALAHNRTAELSEWDETVKALELAGIKGIDMRLLGFDDADAQTPDSAEDIVEDDPPEVPEEPTARRGQIYQLGEHRLMCGDSTSRADMDRLIGDEPPVFVFTDPPYGVAIGDKNATLNTVQKAGQCCENIEGDTLDEQALRAMLTSAMANLREHCDEGCSYYVSAPQGGGAGPDDDDDEGRGAGGAAQPDMGQKCRHLFAGAAGLRLSA